MMEIELDFDHYLSIFRIHLTGENNRDAPWHQKAERLHALRVNDATLDVMMSAIILAEACPRLDAANHLTHGLGRRLKFIWLSVRSLISVSPPDRTEPMTSDEVATAARDLNVIYINIRGSLDNLAWSLPSLFEHAGTINPMSVDLFSNAYLRKVGAHVLVSTLDPFREWARDLAQRRNPAAHRIPLSVSPTVLDSNSRAKWERSRRAAADAQAAAFAAYRPGYYPEKEFAAARTALEATEKIGTYMPVFVHHPDAGAQPIYPLVANDIGTLLLVTRAFIDTIRTDRLFVSVGAGS